MESQGAPPKDGRRLLLAAGTANFSKTEKVDLVGVPGEISELSRTFVALQYERQLEEASLNPDSRGLLQLFASFSDLCQDGDLAVVYYTSHGESSEAERGRFYFWTTDTDRKLHLSAVAAEDAARALVLDSKASQLLVILDMCFAGRGALDFFKAVGRFTSAATGEGPELYVIAAAHEYQEADQRALTIAIREAVKNRFGQINGRALEYLSEGDFVGGINQHLEKINSLQRARLTSSTASPCRIFRNPHYVPGLPPNSTLDQHFAEEAWNSEGALGAPRDPTNWYFTGRSIAVKELKTWLGANESDGSLYVITGGPGCGKSALMRRLQSLPIVKLSRWIAGVKESLTTSQIPVPRPVPKAAFVSARGMLCEELASQLGTELGFRGTRTEDLTEAVAKSPTRFIVVIDALDESEEAPDIAKLLILPLARLPNVFIVVASRPDSVGEKKRVKLLSEISKEIDLDDERYIGDGDIAKFVEKRLRATEEPNRDTPYRHNLDLAKRIAAAVAQRADGNYLVAVTAVQALLASDSPVNMNDDEWLAALPSGLDRAFSQFVQAASTRAQGAVAADLLTAVLVALAFAEGQGMPWVGIWPATASALSGRRVSNEDIVVVQQRAAAFIVEASEQNGSVYRLCHELLASNLRSLYDERVGQQRVLMGLLEDCRTEKFDWQLAHPYLLRHLAAHSMKAGALDDLLRRTGYINYADPPRLLLALARSSEPLARKIFPVYSIAFDRLRSVAPAIRKSYLQMTAGQQQENGLLSLLDDSADSSSWTAKWTHWFAASTHRTIDVDEKVTALTTGSVDGKEVVVAGGLGKLVRIFDLASGEGIGEPLAGSRYPIRAIGIMSTSTEDPFVVAAGDDKRIHSWNLDGSAHWPALTGHKSGVLSLAIDPYTGAGISGGRDGRLIAWDLKDGRRGDHSWLGREDGAAAIALGFFRGRKVVFFGTGNGTIGAWDATSGERVEIPKYRRISEVKALVYLPSSDAVAAGYSDGRIRIWNQVTGDPLEWDGHAEGVHALGLDNRENFLVSAGADGAVKLWNPHTGEAIGSPLTGHNGAVNTVVVARLEGRTVIVSGGDDATIRVWELPIDSPATSPRSMSGRRLTVFSACNSIAATGDSDGTVRAWNIGTGSDIASLQGNSRDLIAVAVATAGQYPLVLAVGSGQVVQVSNADPGGDHKYTVHHHQRRVTALALHLLDEHRPLLASAEEGGKLLLQSPFSELLECQPFFSRATANALTFAVFPGGTVLLSANDDGSLQGWDAVRGIERFTAIAHRESVRSIEICEWDSEFGVLSGGEDGQVILWAFEGISIVPKHSVSVPGVVTAASMLPLGLNPVLVAGCSDGVLRIYLANNRLIGEIDVGAEIIGVRCLENASICVATRRGIMLIEAKDYLLESLWRESFVNHRKMRESEL